MVAPHHGHDLRGARFLGSDGSPALLKRRDQEFVPALLRELRSPEGRAETRRSVAADRDGQRVLRLYQPVHRVFHLSVLELVCRPHVAERANPARIVGSGLVVRRIALSRDASGRPLPYDLSLKPEEQPVEGWMKDGDRVRGWMRLGGRADQDPDPRHRRPPLRAGNATVTARLRQPDLEWDRWAEAHSPLFVAPPEACEAAGATLLYGVVPTTSSEQTEAELEPPQVDDAGLVAMIPPFLQPGAHSLPANLKPDRLPDDEGEQAAFLDAVRDVSLLRGLDAFDGSPAGNRLVALLNRVPVAHEPRGLGAALAAAARAFESEDAKGPGAVHWTIPSEAWFRNELKEALRGLLNRKLDALTAGVGRFERRGALYQVRAFARVKRCDACPPELVWSAPSAPFAIVPWYEDGGGAPVKVQLPSARLAELSKLKPNVAFEVPSSVQDLLGGMKIKTPMEVQPGNLKLGLDWICGFSIPLITLCAFIVLSIFLSLLNIIFWWLPFIKVCIPIPTASRSERT